MYFIKNKWRQIWNIFEFWKLWIFEEILENKENNCLIESYWKIYLDLVSLWVCTTDISHSLNSQHLIPTVNV